MEEPNLVGVPDPQASEAFRFLRPILIALVALLILCILTICYFASAIILPIVLATVLKLLLEPPMRVLERLRIPRGIAAFLLILVVFSLIVGIGAAVSGPAVEWAARLPDGIPRLQERLRFLSEPVNTLRTFLQRMDGLMGSGPSTGGSYASAVAASFVRGTTSAAGSFFETMLILFFMLVSGSTFLRRVVEIVPSFREKRQVVGIAQQIERNVSGYLITITVMNAAVGIATGVATWATGLGDPVLWGTTAFLLNYVPIMGPMAVLFILLLAGLLTMDVLWMALLPCGLYLAIHLVEGELITPMIVARHLTLNPVLVIVALLFWFWMWGVPGAILAVPMLAITKIVCDGIGPLAPIGHFLSGDAE